MYITHHFLPLSSNEMNFGITWRTERGKSSYMLTKIFLIIQQPFLLWLALTKIVFTKKGVQMTRLIYIYTQVSCRMGLCNISVCPS